MLHRWGESVQHLWLVAEVDMLRSARFFLCARCRDQVLLCSHCDRGQLYCGPACSSAGRRELRRQTAKRYQESRRGRLKHAARTACWRSRRRAKHLAGAAGDVDKVTHQGCPQPLADASLLACDLPSDCQLIALPELAVGAPCASTTVVSLAAPVCRRCAHPLLPHVRLHWLRSNSVGRQRHHDHPS